MLGKIYCDSIFLSVLSFSGLYHPVLSYFILCCPSLSFRVIISHVLCCLVLYGVAMHVNIRKGS